MYKVILILYVNASMGNVESKTRKKLLYEYDKLFKLVTKKTYKKDC